MTSRSDHIYAVGSIAASIFLSAFTLLLSIVPVNYDGTIPAKTVIEYMLTVNGEIFLTSSGHSAPLICCSVNNRWFALFLPLLCALPSIRRISAELNGNYRLQLVREKSFSRYWSKTFLRSGFFGAVCVTVGFLIFCTAVFCYFPHNAEYLLEYPENSLEELTLQRKLLDSPLNKLFGTQSELLYIFNCALTIFVFAFVISVLCLTTYLLVKNSYKALGLPMIAFFLLEQSVDSMWLKGNTKALAFCPKYIVFWTEYSLGQWNLGAWWYYAFTAAFTSAFYLLGRLIFRKRVMN